MRISKDPQVRKREIMDAAMKLFAQKGYEATSMTDIAKEVKVVSGLCYRYFRSKEDLYYEALDMYAEECSVPMIKFFNEEYNSVEQLLESLIKVFESQEGKYKYHDFFHKEGNLLFHKQLEGKMIEKIEPYLVKSIKVMEEKNIIKIDNAEIISKFALSGAMRIINDESINIKYKMVLLKNIIIKLFE